MFINSHGLFYLSQAAYGNYRWQMKHKNLEVKDERK